MYNFYKSKYIITGNDKILEDSALVVKDGIVFDIIKSHEIPEDKKITDFNNAVITPGFVNLHTHLQYTNLNPVFSPDNIDKNIDFSDWIINLIQQYSLWTEEQKIKSFQNGLRQAVLSGCTCIAQLSREEAFINILEKLNLKSFIFLETFSNNEEKSKQEIEMLKTKIKQNTSKNLTIGISPHSIYNVHESLWKEIAVFSSKEGISVHTHLAESTDEIDWLNNKCSGINKIHNFVKWDKIKPYKSGLNPVEYLEKLGVLEIVKENLTAAHCIELDEKQLEKLVNFGVKIAHCPRSNMLLHKKTLDCNKIPESILQNTGLGTDGRLSNYDLSILNEANYIKDYTGLDFNKIINMLTINSARILKINDKTGSLEKGKHADFLVFTLNENESFQDILQKEKPKEVYIEGKLTAKNGYFTAEQWKFLNEPEQYQYL